MRIINLKKMVHVIYILINLCCAGVGRLRSGSESEQRVSMRVHRSGTSNAQTPELSRPADRCVEEWANR